MQKERAHNGEHGLICGKHEADDRKAHQAGHHAPAGLTKRPGQPKKARLYYLIPFHNVAYTNHDAIRIFHAVIYIIHDVKQTLSVTTGLLVGVRGFAVTAHAFPFAARHNPPIMPAKSANPPTTSTRNTGTSLFGPRIRRQEGAKPTTTDKHSLALPKAMVYVNEASPKVAPDAITPCITYGRRTDIRARLPSPHGASTHHAKAFRTPFATHSGRFFQPQESRFVMAQKNGKEFRTPCRDNVFNEDRT